MNPARADADSHGLRCCICRYPLTTTRPSGMVKCSECGIITHRATNCWVTMLLLALKFATILLIFWASWEVYTRIGSSVRRADQMTEVDIAISEVFERRTPLPSQAKSIWQANITRYPRPLIIAIVYAIVGTVSVILLWLQGQVWVRRRIARVLIHGV